MSLNYLFSKLKGGPRSGNRGHSGRPGKRGGSSLGRSVSPLIVSSKTGLPEGDYESVYNDTSRDKALKKAISLGVPAHQMVRVNGTYHVVNVASIQLTSTKPEMAPPAHEASIAKGSSKFEPTYDANVSENVRQQVQSVLQRIPESHLGQLPGGGSKLRSLEVKDKSSVSEELDKTCANPPCSTGGGIVGGFAYNSGDKVGHVVVAGNVEFRTIGNVVAHEVGHVVFDYTGVKELTPIKTKQSDYINSVKAKLEAVYNERQKGFSEMVAVSEYARSDVREFRAEAYGFYVTNPAILKDKDPEVYKIIEGMF